MSKVRKTADSPAEFVWSQTDLQRRAAAKAMLHQENWKNASDQLASLSKWLTASLFVANSGALIALFNKSESLAELSLSG